MNKTKSAIKVIKSFMPMNAGVIVMNVIYLLFSLALIVLSAIKGENPGDMEYLISIGACSLGMMFINLTLCLNLTRLENRFFYSTPYAKPIVTKTIPLVTLVTAIIFTAISVITTAIGIGTGLLTGNRMSDLFIILSYTMALVVIIPSCMKVVSFMLIWLTPLPFYVNAFAEDIPSFFFSEINKNGFGLPLYVSVIIFIAALAVSYIIARIIAKDSYKRRSTKYMQNLTSTATMYAK